MGLDDLVNKGKGYLDQHRDQVDKALRSEQAEKISDRIMDAGGGVAKKFAPDQHDAKVDEIRRNLDKKIGNE
jgi:polyhydroxyalkanoate synthesis regulator phasin